MQGLRTKRLRLRGIPHTGRKARSTPFCYAEESLRRLPVAQRTSTLANNASRLQLDDPIVTIAGTQRERDGALTGAVVSDGHHTHLQEGLTGHTGAKQTLKRQTTQDALLVDFLLVRAWNLWKSRLCFELNFDHGRKS